MRNPWGGNPGQSADRNGMLNIPNDENFISLIDLRIVEPGKAGVKVVFDPYMPPPFRSSYGMRVDKSLLLPIN